MQLDSVLSQRNAASMPTPAEAGPAACEASSYDEAAKFAAAESPPGFLKPEDSESAMFDAAESPSDSQNIAGALA